MSRSLLLLVAAFSLYHANVFGAGDRPQANIEPHYKCEWDRRNGDFRPGDWADYEGQLQEGLKVRYTIEEVGDRFLIVMVTSIQGDQIYNVEGKLTFTMDIPATEKWAEFPETFELGDKELAVKRIDITYKTGSVKRKWVCLDVPVLGIVKTETGLGKINLQLSDYGRGPVQPPSEKKSEKPEKAEKSEKSENAEKSEQAEKPEKSEKSEKPEKLAPAAQAPVPAAPAIPAQAPNPAPAVPAQAPTPAPEKSASN